MKEYTMRKCKRNNLCVDCDNTDCLHAGHAMADCPQYGCDNIPKYKCEECEFIKEYQAGMRAEYQKGV